MYDLAYELKFFKENIAKLHFTKDVAYPTINHKLECCKSPHQICPLETVFFEIVPDAEGKFEKVKIENGFEKY